MAKKKAKASVAPEAVELAVVQPPPAVVAKAPEVVPPPPTTAASITQVDSFSFGKPDLQPTSTKAVRPQWLVAQHEADFPPVVGAAPAASGGAAAEVTPAAAVSSKSGVTGSRASRVKAPASAITIKPARSVTPVVDASLVPPRQQHAAPVAVAAQRPDFIRPYSSDETILIDHRLDEPFERHIQAGIPMGDDFECDVNGHY